MKTHLPIHILISSTKNTADIRYLCGAEPPETAMLIQTGSRGTLIVSEMEYSRLRRTVKRGITVLHPEMIGSSWKKGSADWIKKCTDKKKLTVSADFPLGLAEKLKRAGSKLKISEGAICPQREIKTADEISAVRNAQRAAVAAMNAAIKQIASSEIGKDGLLRCGKTILTSELVRATICHTLLDHDCIATETIVACGPHSADPHERGTGPLRAGQPIVLDIFPRSTATGYWGDLTRTVCRGPAPAELKKMYNAVKAAHAAALKVVKAGAWTDDVHAAAAGELDCRGFQTGAVNGVPQGFIHGTGHGVGLEIHEAPRVSSAVHKKLRAGNIITIEPGLYYPHIGGIRIEDTILVTKDGYQMLASCPKRFEY
ncbi:MAG: aminopeptidase P family protein [Kiritimatiellaceae bacterium]|nr:aminopeptidase P family protein [Kiritimatiellaceae bacterium]